MDILGAIIAGTLTLVFIVLGVYIAFTVHPGMLLASAGGLTIFVILGRWLAELLVESDSTNTD